MVRRTVLFNTKTIEKFCDNIEITEKQRSAAAKWLELLRKNELKDEQSNYPKFQQLILQDLLDYSLDQIIFEKNNMEYQIKNSEDVKIIGIEAKGTSKDLFSYQHYGKKEQEKPITQLASYMFTNNLEYGICTNYNDFVLIMKQFGLTKLHTFKFDSIRNNEKKLKEFIGIFGKDRVLQKGFIEKIYKESIEEDKELTKEFYDIFHQTRRMLIKEFEQNPEVSTDEAIHYAQLYLNRLIFVFFVEDHGFIYNRTFSEQISTVLKPELLVEHTRLVYERINTLFTWLNIGCKIPPIFGFNGGLFSEQIPSKIYFEDLREKSIFNGILKDVKSSKKSKLNEFAEQTVKKIGDNLNPIIVNLWKMNSYDFTSQLNVDILGHIFEQSITDLEEIRNQTVSKRKKDGVYYTPEYITDYICRNTIIPYLSKNNSTSVADLVREYADNIPELEGKIKEIKILDPSCGSGAFLIKAVDLLLEIHKEIQSYKAPRVVEQFQLTEFNEDKEIYNIIENNIYGVDVNEESVEITKLSLFLKLAGPNRKLIGLSRNIKMGNSLVEDKVIDAKGFDWKHEFPEVMHEKYGGFDIVIGNPPYLNVKGLHESHDHTTKFFEENFQSATERYDFYVLFVEKASKLVKKNGFLSFILPHKFINAQFGKGLRKYFLDTKILYSIISFGHNLVFEDSTTYTGILTLRQTKNDHISYAEIENLKTSSIEGDLLSLTSKDFTRINLDNLTEKPWILKPVLTFSILKKIRTNGKNIMEFFDMVMSGLQTADNDLYVLTPIKDKGDTMILYSKKIEGEVEIEKDVLKPVLKGEDVKRYEDYPIPPRFVIYPYIIEDEKQRPMEEDELKQKYPLTYKYMLPFKQDLIKLRTSFKTNPKYWHGLHRSRVLRKFEQEKIITPEISLGCNMTLDTRKYLHTEKVYNLLKKSETKQDIRYFLAVLNSKVMWFFLKNSGDILRGGFFTFKTQYIEPFYVPEPPKKVEDEIVKNVNKILELKTEFREKHDTFLNLLKINFKIQKPSKMIDEFHKLNFELFLKEITEITKTKLTVDEQVEWMKQFESFKKSLLEIITSIKKIDNSNNKMIYELYKFTDHDIEIIEENYPNQD